MTTQQSAGLQLDPRAQATLQALTNEALDPRHVRMQCIFGLVVCCFFLALFVGLGIAGTIIGAIGGGLTGFFAGLSLFIFPGALALIPGYAGYRTLRVLRALPRS